MCLTQSIRKNLPRITDYGSGFRLIVSSTVRNSNGHSITYERETVVRGTYDNFRNCRKR